LVPIRRSWPVAGVIVAAGVAAASWSGIAVHAGPRLAGIARPGEVLVSGTIRGLVAGSGIGFDDRGERTLRGHYRPVAPVRGARW
jgi:class 3 adenylate cyclase